MTTPNQSRAIARWLATLSPERSMAVRRRIQRASDEWQALTADEREEAMALYRTQATPPPTTRP